MLKALASLHPLLYCLWYAAPVSLYFLYRALGCAASHWECRVKSARQTFEDVAMLLVFSVLLMLLDHLEPFDTDLPAPSASLASSSGSEEEELHGTASFKHLPHARAQPTRQRALTRPLLLVLGYVTAFAAAMVLGVSGASIRTSFDAWAMWAPPTIYIVGPLLGLVGLCICLGARASFLAGPEQLLLWLAILAAALGYHLLGLAISRGVAAPFTTSNLCERLVFHPHHYTLSFFAALLMRRHGLHQHSGALATAVGLLVYACKCAMVGMFIQGVAQYGPDSLLRATSCASS